MLLYVLGYLSLGTQANGSLWWLPRRRAAGSPCTHTYTSNKYYQVTWNTVLLVNWVPGFLFAHPLQTSVLHLSFSSLQGEQHTSMGLTFLLLPLGRFILGLLPGFIPLIHVNFCPPREPATSPETQALTQHTWAVLALPSQVQLYFPFSKASRLLSHCCSSAESQPSFDSEGF